jgi:GTP pyrophosphokinase
MKIARTYEELERLVEKSYSAPDLDLLRRAFALAERAHAGELRLTGHPVISHPITVAYRLAEMGLHMHVVVAGLLHDIVEDSDITVEDVQEQFGEDIASLVESVTKLKHGIKYKGSDR